jgi:uncharacterized protein
LKIVVDTNVFISGVYFGGYPYRILTSWNDGALVLVVSKEILGEYLRISEILAVQHPASISNPYWSLSK